MRPRLPASNLDLAWLGGLLPLAMFGGLFLWWGSGLGCDTPCKTPFPAETVLWSAGVAASLATLWLRWTRPLLTAATIGLLAPIGRFVLVLAS